MNIKRQSPRSGIALIVVMIVVTFLAILAGGFAYSMKVETKLARNSSFDGELEWLGRSGVELARYVLAQSAVGPNGQADSLNQKWAGGLGDTNNALAGIDLKNYPLGNGTVSLEIKDLDRKFNVNVADDAILRQALTMVGVDASVIPTIADSIQDWRDPDDDPHMSGSESGYYETLNPPYHAKNGPFDDLTELLLIKGVTPAMYWGSSAGAHVATVHKQMNASESHFDEPTYAVGMADVFTTTSSRLVNINTASTTVLQIFPEIDENVAQSIITSRCGPDGAAGTEDDTPFRSVAELARVPGINPALLQNFGRYFTVRSLMFEVKADVQVAGNKRQYIALLRRNGPNNIEIMNFYWR